MSSAPEFKRLPITDAQRRAALAEPFAGAGEVMRQELIIGAAPDAISPGEQVGTSGASEPKTPNPILQALDTGTNRGGGPG